MPTPEPLNPNSVSTESIVRGHLAAVAKGRSTGRGEVYVRHFTDWIESLKPKSSEPQTVVAAATQVGKDPESPAAVAALSSALQFVTWDAELIRRLQVILPAVTIVVGTQNNYYADSPALTTFAERVAASRDYLKFLADDCGRLRLSGLDDKANDPQLQTKVTLEAVYVGLLTTATEDDESTARSDRRPISAFEAVVTHAQVVLLGRPGSGKTTFFNHLAFRLARHWREPNQGWLRPFPQWSTLPPQLLPVAVTLRQLVRSLDADLVTEIERDFARGCPQPAQVKVLWDFLEQQLGQKRLQHCLPALESATQAGEVIWFFDGLDEVPTAALRTFVRSLIEAFMRRYDQARFVLTCRIVAYQDPRWQLRGLPDFTLAPLDEEQQGEFIRAWFKAHQEFCGMAQEEAEAKARKLLDALRDSRRRDLKEMAGEPLLLTLMALLQTGNRELPENRAELYQQAVELLLKRWDDVRSLDGTALASLPQALRDVGSDHNELQRVLWHLAFHAQREEFSRRRSGTLERSRDTADIPHATLVRFLAWLHPKDSKDWVEKTLIPLIQERAGLLLEVGHDADHQPLYSFPHRSFQEYLAGAALPDEPLSKPPKPGQREPPEPVPFPRRAIELVETSGYWHEVIRWLASRLTHVNNSAHACLGFLKELTPEQPQSETDWNRVWLAADALVEMRVEKARKDRQGRELLREIPGLLRTLVEQEKLPAKARVLAGIALGQLGDARPGVGLRADAPNLPWFEWSQELTTGGVFRMKEGPERRIAKRYRLGIYPVTVAQYSVFMKEGYGVADGEKPAWWTAAGWEWRCQQAVSGPAEISAVFETVNHPQVGVSWYEANAYCGWLRASFGPQALGLPEGWEIRLPGEAEWEYAASAGGTREYPFAGTAEWTRRGNVLGTGIGHTSAVGLFPGGMAECGAFDLAGNVWEWCRSVYSEKGNRGEDLEGEEGRCVRGGAWISNSGSARASFRGRGDPEIRNFILGFRLAASPISEI